VNISEKKHALHLKEEKRQQQRQTKCLKKAERKPEIEINKQKRKLDKNFNL